MYPAELDIKDTTEITTSASYQDLILLIWRDGQLHTANEMISISTSLTFRSWVVIFQPCPPMAFLSLSLCATPGFAPRMNVLFWGPGDFPVSYSNRDTSWDAWNRNSGSFMVDTGGPWSVTVTSKPIRLSTNFMTLLRILTFTELPVVSMEHLQRMWYAGYAYIPTPASILFKGAFKYTDCWDKFSRPYIDWWPYQTWLLPNLEVSMEHLQRVLHTSRERLPFRSPGSIPLFGTCLCSNGWDYFARIRRAFSRLALNTPRYFLDSAFNMEKFGCSQNATNWTKSTVECGYMCPRGRNNTKI